MAATGDESAFVPVRWAAAGFLGGASLIGMLWAILGRAPALPVQSPPTQNAGVRITERATPGTPPPRSGVAAAPRSPGPEAPFSEDEDESLETGPGDTGGIEPERAAGMPPEPVIQDPPPTRTPIAGDRLNINTATAAELELLPRIGPTLAARIVEFREREGRIRSLSHLMEVRGIGERTIELLEPYIRFE
jgi:competence ComEA-like helix-hairpin-helix protein